MTVKNFLGLYILNSFLAVYILCKEETAFLELKENGFFEENVHCRQWPINFHGLIIARDILVEEQL